MGFAGFYAIGENDARDARHHDEDELREDDTGIDEVVEWPITRDSDTTD